MGKDLVNGNHAINERVPRMGLNQIGRPFDAALPPASALAAKIAGSRRKVKG